MWSGPRNLSTALLRSFENRNDTVVLDEPLYAYYLKETNKKHPLNKKIIETYETDIKKLINIISRNNDKIFYQKHMTHHILEETPLDWISTGVNCFLIRDPKDVLLSYITKKQLDDVNDLGFPMQLKLFNTVKDLGNEPIIINADDLSNNPKKILIALCNKIKIPFSEKMLFWPKGKRDTDGIWGKVWYKNVELSDKFAELKKNNSEIPKEYNKIYLESLKIYKKLNSFNIINE